jgi:hypothetical protein
VIPAAVLGYVAFALLIKKRPWKQVMPDLQVAIFVCIVYYIVYFVLLK